MKLLILWLVARIYLIIDSKLQPMIHFIIYRCPNLFGFLIIHTATSYQDNRPGNMTDADWGTLKLFVFVTLRLLEA